MSRSYALGIDFGTQSARAVLVDTFDGHVAGESTRAYPGGVIDRVLPGTGGPLEPGSALQDPSDYLYVLGEIVPEAMARARVEARDIIGIGTDFTACTLIPVDAGGRPLSTIPQYRSSPHAWAKLWKHHAAQHEADEINRLAAERHERFRLRYGGRVSSEWELPKIWEVLRKAPEIYSAAHSFIEAGDWVTFMLTGKRTRNSCAAGYKGLWHDREGYPSNEFLHALDPRLVDVFRDKLGLRVDSVGSLAGGLTEAAALPLGLLPGTPVSVSTIDAHAAVPAAGVATPGTMVMIMGTSTCHMLLADREVPVPGVGGVVKDGIVPGYYGYESGQAAVGDIFEWFVENAVPGRYEREADARGVSIHELLAEKSGMLPAGGTGLIALDWWNGNRSVLGDSDLSGMMLGLTLQTTPEQIYRALIESTAFGTRVILDAHLANGLQVSQLVACGGLAHKADLLMQIYSDVLGSPIHVPQVLQASAVGAAMFGALAAGRARGGFDTISEAAEHMIPSGGRTFHPDSTSVVTYDRLYREYLELHDHFGRGVTPVMRRLRDELLRAARPAETSVVAPSRTPPNPGL